MMQGRRDFAFGMGQALQAYNALAGPKRLWLGLHGHAPSTFPAADSAAMLAEGTQWFDHYLAADPNGIDARSRSRRAGELEAGRRLAFEAPSRAAIAQIFDASAASAVDRADRASVRRTLELPARNGHSRSSALRR